MRVYADSSFIASIYLPEARTPHALRAVAEMRTAGDNLLLGELTRLEVANAVQLGVFRKVRTELKASESLDMFNSNIEAGVFRLVASPPAMWKTARELSARHTGLSGCRSLDILHVATALLLNTELFLTFDIRQRTLAVAAGLNAPDLIYS